MRCCYHFSCEAASQWRQFNDIVDPIDMFSMTMLYYIMDYKFHYCFKWLTENEFIWRNGIHKIVGNKVKGWISKRVFQENKANQVFRKTIISYPLIRLDVSQIPVDTERFELEFHHQISAVRSYNKGKDFY